MITSRELSETVRLSMPSFAAEWDYLREGSKDNPHEYGTPGWMEYEQTWDTLEIEDGKTREPEGYDES